MVLDRAQGRGWAGGVQNFQDRKAGMSISYEVSYRSKIQASAHYPDDGAVKVRT